MSKIFSSRRLWGRALRMVVAVATVALPVLIVAPAAHADGSGDMVGWVNGLRRGSGVASLASDPSLAGVAQQWASQMAATGVLAHNPNLSTQAPQGWTKMGENVGSGYSLNAVYNAFAASQYSANILDPAYNRTGVGIATDSKGQVWVAEDFAAYPPPVPAAMSFPTTGTFIFPAAQTFSWALAPGAIYYALNLGTTKGGVDLLNSGLLPASQLSYPVAALPGGQLWARIYTYTQGVWIYSDASFTVTGAATATFTRPTNGATKVDTTQTFMWSPVASAGYYGLTIGTTKGGADVLNAGLIASSQTSYQATMPAGKVLWARVYSFIAGNWNHYSDVCFTTTTR